MMFLNAIDKLFGRKWLNWFEDSMMYLHIISPRCLSEQLFYPFSHNHKASVRVQLRWDNSRREIRPLGWFWTWRSCTPGCWLTEHRELLSEEGRSKWCSFYAKLSNPVLISIIIPPSSHFISRLNSIDCFVHKHACIIHDGALLQRNLNSCLEGLDSRLKATDSRLEAINSRLEVMDIRHIEIITLLHNLISSLKATDLHLEGILI